MQHDDDYLPWRETKLDRAPPDPDLLRVHIADPGALTAAESAALEASCRRHNFALFRLEQPAEDLPKALLQLGAQLGLRRLDRNPEAGEDGVSALRDRAEDGGSRYVPYTNKPLSWHTDGYYNPPERQIRAWVLYCAEAAAEGGDNELLDHDIAYIRLRDHDPALARALERTDAFTIPANRADGVQLRPAQTGPVFSWMADTGRLHMRYSARQRNIVWRDEPAVRAAAAFLQRLFLDGDAHTLRYRLRPGEGLISNNALHRRSGFRDDRTAGRRRLVYRARYYDRVVNT
jgi:alpha-ketoglutarate-dependent taurine dioxygenase